MRFARFGDKGLKLITTSPDTSIMISDLELETTHAFRPQDKTEIHEHWVTMVEWNEDLGMMLSYSHDKNIAMVLFD